MAIKRIILFGSSLGIGGAERSLVSVANFLASQQGVSVMVVTIKGGALAVDFLPAVKHIVIGGRVRAFFRLLLRERWNADIVVNYHDWNYFAGWFVHQAKADVKLLWVHNQRKKILNCVARFFYRYFGRRSSCKVVAVGSLAAQSHAHIFDLCEQKITVIGNLIDTDYRNAFAPGIVINIARGAAIKNHPLMIKVLKELASMVKDVKFRQYGIEPGSVYANMYAQGLKNVNLDWKLCRPLNHPWSEINGAVIVLPSFHEGQGLVMLEALSHQINVITTNQNTGNISWIYDNKEKGAITTFDLSDNPQAIAEKIKLKLNDQPIDEMAKIKKYEQSVVAALKKVFSLE